MKRDWSEPMFWLVVLTITVFLLPILAAKFKPTGGETCFVVPNPVYDGETFTITGEHFVPGMNVAAFVGDGGVVISRTNEEGVFEADDFASFGSAGVIQVLVRYECGDNRPWESCDRRARSAATCYFQANGPPPSTAIDY